jgi:sigma-E factor negative regulatory protein RseB
VASDGADGVSPPPSDASATDLLRRSAQAAASTPYQGVQSISAWSAGAESRTVISVEHVPGFGSLLHVGGTQLVVLDSGSEGSEAQEEAGDLPQAHSVLAGGSVDLIEAHYGCVLGGEAAVAGRPADVVEARRADGSVAGRLWLDHDSGLLLRREVYAKDGTPANTSTFVSIGLTEPVLPGHLPPALPVRPHSVKRAGLAVSAGGFPTPPQRLGGLSLRSVSNDDPDSLELVYSDGLSTLSVFEQHGHLRTKVGPGWTSVTWDGRRVQVRGTLPVQVVWNARGVVYTVVSDAPTQTLRAAVAALPHERRPSVLERIGNGFGRVGSWINPFS